MKKIMIDLDDVIVDQQNWMYMVNSFLKTNYTIDDVKGYYIQDLVPKDKMEEYTKYFISQNLYDHAVIYPDCIDVIRKLNEKYEVYICSSYVFRDDILYSADSLKYKFKFLYKNFPFLDPNRFTFLTNKSMFDCEIKIDDKISNLESAEMKLLFNAYHNKNISNEELKEQGVIRVLGWKDIEKILLDK